VAISLFEKRQLNHVCYASEEDVTRELLTLLELARTVYKEDGVPDKKSVARFIEDFVNEQWHIDCSKACCRNLHRRNINIVGGILARRDLLARLKEMESLTLEECKEILHLYNASAPPPVLWSNSTSEATSSLRHTDTSDVPPVLRSIDTTDATRAISPTNAPDAPPSTRQAGTTDTPPALRSTGAPDVPPSSPTPDTRETPASSGPIGTSDTTPLRPATNTTDAPPSKRQDGTPDVPPSSDPDNTSDTPSSHPTYRHDNALSSQDINIISGILARRDLLARLTETGSLTLEECKDILRRYDISDAPPPVLRSNSTSEATSSLRHTDTSDAPPSLRPTGIPYTAPPRLSFGCTLTEEQMLHLSQLESMEHLFCIKENETLDLRPLLQCKDGYTLKVRNPQLVALFFDTLCNEGKIRWDWKIIMERGGFLVSKKGKAISASALAVNLHRAIMGNNPDAEKYKSEWLYYLRTSTFIRK
jgi:hypothetical protein